MSQKMLQLVEHANCVWHCLAGISRDAHEKDMGTNTPPDHHTCWLLNLTLLTIWLFLFLFLFNPEDKTFIIPQNNLKRRLVRTQHTFFHLLSVHLSLLQASNSTWVHIFKSLSVQYLLIFILYSRKYIIAFCFYLFHTVTQLFWNRCHEIKNIFWRLHKSDFDQ